MNRIAKAVIVIGLAVASVGVWASTAAASFGINSASTTATAEDGSILTQAGAHPFGYTVEVVMNQDASHRAEGTLRNLIVSLPPGISGNPLAVPQCARVDLAGSLQVCPPNTQVGVAVAHVGKLVVTAPVSNLVPPPGVAASFGFSILGFNSFQMVSLRGSDYGFTVEDNSVPIRLNIVSIKETIWGVPAEKSHDPDRFCDANIKGCESGVPPVPFLSLPTACGGPLATTIQAESLEEPGVLTPPTVAVTRDSGGSPVGLSGCEKPPFKPTITAQPETASADSPTGLHFNLHIPQNEDPKGLATSHLRDTVVALPKGFTLNPSSATGLAGCAPAQIALGTNLPAQCPAGSKIGTVSIKTPALDHPVTGAVYVATQGDNPFHSLIALYIAVEDPITGVVVKLAGEVQPDPATGQLEARFRNNPQLQFEDVDLQFVGGPRAALTTPFICGTYTTTSDLTPWTAPAGADAFPSSSFQIEAGAQGGRCPANESEGENRPRFEAGTSIPIAGSYSPFLVKLSRENGSQRFGAIDTSLPLGLVAKLAGIPYCSDAQINAAAARNGLGQGALEQASPSCPLASEVGLATVGAGSGSPFYVQGHVYLAGPYKGAPLSLVTITPAVAGPFDLGTVVVRIAAYVNETTGQVRAVSDRIPSMLAGIPLDVRSIAVNVNRTDFMLNPTNCNPMAALAAVTSTLDQTASLSSRFKVGACGALKFKPQLAISLKGNMRRAQHPRLRAEIVYPKGEYANTSRAAVTLPRTEFIDPERVANPCTRPQFSEGKCPKDSVLGTVKAFTPLFDKPLTGKVYFRANGGERELPDIVLDLNGQVHFVQVGHVDAVVKKGTEISRVRNTFVGIPDAPLSKVVLELKGGKEGLLQNSANLCMAPIQAAARFRAQNGLSYDTNPTIKTSCGQKKKK